MPFQEHKDGEILAELIPARYELRDIIKDEWRTMNSTNATILGTTVLSNTGEYSNTVETVITYSFNRTIYWATVEGLIRGLPTSVYDNANSSPYSLAKGWGFKIFEPVTEVSHYFHPYVHSKCNVILMIWSQLNIRNFTNDSYRLNKSVLVYNPELR